MLSGDSAARAWRLSAPELRRESQRSAQPNDLGGVSVGVSTPKARCSTSTQRPPTALGRVSPLQYAWLRSSPGRCVDFCNVAGDALDRLGLADVDLFGPASMSLGVSACRAA